jgi:aquaporin Z
MAVKPTATEAEPGTGQSQPARRRAWSQFGSSGAEGASAVDTSMARRYGAELLGTGLLVFFGAGMATVNFGFRAFGSSVAAGIMLTGLVFGLVLLGLFAVIGPISGCHVNPAVSLGACLARRISVVNMVGYWIAQLVGGLLGALLLWGVLNSSPFYSRSRIGLGANGYGRLSLLHSSGGGAFLIEVILTAVFVLVVLSASRRGVNVAAGGVAMAVALALVNIMGIPIDGASVNPARSFGPAIVVGGLPLSQLWLFLVAPLVGAVLAAGVYMLFSPASESALAARAGGVRAEPEMTMSAADESLAEPSAGRTATTTQAMPPGTQRVVSGGQTPGSREAGSGATSSQQPPADPGAGTGTGTTPPDGNRLNQLAGASRGW